MVLMRDILEASNHNNAQHNKMPRPQTVRAATN